MVDELPYPNGPAVLSAITQKARTAHRNGIGTSVQELIDLAVFDRFLCRVFSQPGCPFALKGGTSILAQLPSSRSTTDVDLETTGMSIETAISHLIDAASIDLGDHFTFTYLRHRNTGGPTQPDLHAAAVTSSVTVQGAGARNPLTVDLAIHTRTPAAPLEIITPAFRLDLTRLGPGVAYRAIAVEDQIADKVCATLGTYAGLTSTRSKDLVDLAILTLTMRLNARQLGVRPVVERWLALSKRIGPMGEGTFLFTMMAAFAELERDMIRERTFDGLTTRPSPRPGVCGDPTVATLPIHLRQSKPDNNTANLNPSRQGHRHLTNDDLQPPQPLAPTTVPLLARPRNQLHDASASIPLVEAS